MQSLKAEKEEQVVYEVQVREKVAGKKVSAGVPVVVSSGLSVGAAATVVAVARFLLV